MIALRTQIKFFLETPQAPPQAQTLDLAPFMGIFQRWIQRKTLEGQLIDVADYRHVFEGPGIVLIGHDSDYAIETRGGRIGLLYTRKRQSDPDLQTQLRSSLRLALAACQLIETETALHPKLKFRADEIEIRFADRLQLPNRPESFDLVKDDLQAVLTGLYGSASVSFAPVTQDARQLFTVAAHAEGTTSIAELANELQPSAEK